MGVVVTGGTSGGADRAVIHFVHRLERHAAALVAGVAGDGAGWNVLRAAAFALAV